MDWKLLIVFVILNAVNVIIQTVRSLATIKCKKFAAACVNALAYGLYTVVVVYTVCDLPLWLKVGVVAIANFIGVFVVKLCEERLRKDKIWLVKIIIPNIYFEKVKESLKKDNIHFTYYDLNKYYVFDIYCETQSETQFVTELNSKYSGKALAFENKLKLL